MLLAGFMTREERLQRLAKRREQGRRLSCADAVLVMRAQSLVIAPEHTPSSVLSSSQNNPISLKSMVPFYKLPSWRGGPGRKPRRLSVQNANIARNIERGQSLVEVMVALALLPTSVFALVVFCHAALRMRHHTDVSRVTLALQNFVILPCYHCLQSVKLLTARLLCSTTRSPFADALKTTRRRTRGSGVCCNRRHCG